MTLMVFLFFERLVFREPLSIMIQPEDSRSGTRPAFAGYDVQIARVYRHFAGGKPEVRGIAHCQAA